MAHVETEAAERVGMNTVWAPDMMIKRKAAAYRIEVSLNWQPTAIDHLCIHEILSEPQQRCLKAVRKVLYTCFQQEKKTSWQKTKFIRKEIEWTLSAPDVGEMVMNTQLQPLTSKEKDHLRHPTIVLLKMGSVAEINRKKRGNCFVTSFQRFGKARKVPYSVSVQLGSNKMMNITSSLVICGWANRSNRWKRLCVRAFCLWTASFGSPPLEGTVMFRRHQNSRN